MDASIHKEEDSPEVPATYSRLSQRGEVGERSGEVAQLLRLVLDNIPQAVFWKDTNLVYRGCNRNFALGAGLSCPEEIEGKTDYQLPWAEEEASWYRVVDRRVMETDRPEINLAETQYQADGKRAWVSTNKVPLHDREGRVVGVLGTFEDITEWKNTQEELKRAHDELEQRIAERTAELEEANARLEREILEREQVEAIEREQRTLAEALCDTSAILNSTLEVEEVLDRILSEIGKVLPHASAFISIIDEGAGGQVRRLSPKQEGRGGQDLRLPLDRLPPLVEMTRTGDLLIIDDTRSSALWNQHCADPGTLAYLGSPIVVKRSVIGFIELHGSVPNFFGPADAERLKAFANQAAIAIKNARLYRGAQETAALEERQRLARDLHDAVSQTLWTVSLMADVLPTLWRTQREEGERVLLRLRELTRGALVEMRTLLMELRPAALTSAKIEDLLRHLVDSVMSRKKIRIHLSARGPFTLPKEVQLAVYRIAQEALNNILRHSRATQAWIRLRCTRDTLNLRIRDDGCGFDSSRVAGDHYGVGIMRERAEAIGAVLSISSGGGTGTSILLDWRVSGRRRSGRVG